MSKPIPKSPTRQTRRKQPQLSSSVPPIVCERCGSPVMHGQNALPIFPAKLLRWSEHPVLSKPLVIRGIISTDGLSRSDMSIAAQLRQRAAMGGEKERAELAAFNALLTECIANALVAELRRDAEAHGVDVLTWLARDESSDQPERPSE